MFYAKDHIATLAMLNVEGRAAWVVLVAQCWNNGSPLDERIAEHLVGKNGLESVRFLLTCENGKVCFDWMEEVRAKQAEKRAKNSENGRLGGRGNTRQRREESERKANGKRKQNETKPSRAANATVSEERSSGKERASEPSRGPDPGVQGVIDHLSAALKVEGIAQSLDGTVKDNRFAAQSLLTKLGKDYPDYDPLESAKALINAAMKDEFHRRNTTSVRYLLNNCGKIAAAARERKKGTHQTLEDREQQLAEVLRNRNAARAAGA